MPVHDWTRVSAGTFHDFHSSWIIHLKETLNGGLLPEDYYAQAEQRATVIPDILTLQTGSSQGNGEGAAGQPSGLQGAIALAEKPPKVRLQLALSEEEAWRLRQRVVAIRHASGHRVVALIEIVSPADKDRPAHVEDFVEKARTAIQQGVHLMAIDLFRPGRHDPAGMNGAVWQRLGGELELPAEKPLSLGSYVAKDLPDAYIEPLAVADALVEMPLFLLPDWYINVPLETTYQVAYRGVPGVWRRALEGDQ